MGLATVWWYKKDYDKAVEYYSKAIEFEPKWGYFWSRGEVWRKKKDFERALKDYNKVLELIPVDDRSPYAVRARKIASEAISDLQNRL
jgi:tetratricopeptide (TPR) repeat protein